MKSRNAGIPCNILKMFENVPENVLKCPKNDLEHHKNVLECPNYVLERLRKG